MRDLIAGATGAPLIVVLDGIEDPHNVGAILRTVDAAGADGVVRQTRHAAALGGAAAKASAGAVSHVRIADVVNIARALEELKACGVWTVGLASDVKKQYDEIDLTLPTRRGRGRRGDRVAAPGPGAVRLGRVNTDARACPEPERVGGDRNRVVRGAPAAPAVPAERLSCLIPSSLTTQGIARLAWDVLKSNFCLAGVAQSGRAADL